MPTLPIITPPHPMGGLKKDEVWAKAEAVLDDVVAVLTTPREQLAARYRGVYVQPGQRKRVRV